MANLELALLGSFNASVQGRPIADFRSEKERALLAYLAMESELSHPRERLAELLWPGTSTSGSRRNLRITLHRLRQRLERAGASGELLHTSRKSIRLDSNHLELDVRRFERLLLPCRDSECHQSGVCAECERRVMTAVDLYQGPFLQDLKLPDSNRFMEWTTAIRERLQRQALTAMHGMTDRLQRRGELAQARRLAERQLELVPWREPAHRQLMGLLARAGEPAAALKQYETCRKALDRHLAVQPTTSTLQLARRIRQSMRTPRPPLPQPATPLIGRRDEFDSLKRRLSLPETRLLTITGMGGIGKTRLALELAHQIDHAFLDGVQLIRLDPTPPEDSLWSILRNELSLREPGGLGPKKHVLDFLAPLERLLIFDSYEGRLPEVETLTSLLNSCPRVKLLVTSQQPLGLKQEHHFPLTGLKQRVEEPSNQAAPSEAAELFLSVVEQHMPKREFDTAQLDIVERICSQLDGLPLGIEMAAASLADRTLEVIEQAITTDPARLGPLAGAPARQRTLRALYDYTCGRVTDSERETLERLAVFESPFQSDAAAEVTGASSAELAALIGSSLLREGLRAELSLHNSVRSFAREDLEKRSSAAASARASHARYYLAMLADKLEDMRGSNQRRALRHLETSWHNLALAWERAVDLEESQLLAKASLPLARFCGLQGRSRTGRTMVDKALRKPQPAESERDSPGPEVARLNLALAELLSDLGQFTRSEQSANLAAQSPEAEVRALARCTQARFALRMGRQAEALELVERAAAWFRSEDHAWGFAQALHQKAMAHWEHSPLKVVLRAQEEAHAAAESAGDPRLVDLTQNNLAATHRKLGNYERARELLAPLVESWAKPEGGQLIWPLINFGLLEFTLGNYQEAEHWLSRALDLSLAKGARLQAARARTSLASALAAQDELEAAKKQAAKAADSLEAIGDRDGATAAQLLQAEILEQQGDLEAARMAYQEVEEVSEAIGFMYGLTVSPVRQGILAKAQNHPQKAAELLLQGLGRSAGSGPRSVALLALSAGADLLRRQHGCTEAEEWLSALANHPNTPGSVRSEIRRWTRDMPAAEPTEPGTDDLAELHSKIEQRLKALAEVQT